MMDISTAEEFVHEWGIWERGRSHGFNQAIGFVEERLRCAEITADQRELLLALYDALVAATIR